MIDLQYSSQSNSHTFNILGLYITHMPDKYTIVPCSNCKNIKIVKGKPETTRCGRCGNRFSFRESRKMHTTDDSEKAREVRTILQARRNDLEEEYEEVKDEIQAISVDDILKSVTKKCLSEVSREAKRKTNTKEDFKQYIIKEGYTEQQAENMFKQFRDQGQIYKRSDNTFGEL